MTYISKHLRPSAYLRYGFFSGVIILLCFILKMFHWISYGLWLERRHDKGALSYFWIFFLVMLTLLIVKGSITASVSYMRRRVMKNKNISHNFWQNICTSFWCTSCAVCQAANEFSGEDGKQFWNVEIVWFEMRKILEKFFDFWITKKINFKRPQKWVRHLAFTPFTSPYYHYF